MGESEQTLVETFVANLSVSRTSRLALDSSPAYLLPFYYQYTKLTDNYAYCILFGNRV